MEAQLAAASRTRFCAEVPVTCLPANYRRRLPRQARLCYVEEPIWDETDQCYVTRIGRTPQAVACVRPVRLSVEEAEAIFQALDAPTSEEQPVYAVPSYVLPEAFRDLDSSRSYDLFDELAQTLRSHALPSSPVSSTSAEADGSVALPTDVPEGVSLPCRLYDSWFVAPTSITDDEGRCLVTVAPLAHRLSGRSSGAVYTVWLDATTLEQAMPVEGSFARLDCHEQRVQVNAFAIEHEAIPPKEEPELVRRGEAAFTATALAEQYQLVPLKDPIYLRKEDVVVRNGNGDAETITLLDTQRILTNAIAQVQRDQASFAQQSCRNSREVERLDVLLTCLEETLDWYKNLPCHKRSPRLLSLSPLDVIENEPVRGRGQRRAPRCIQLVVGVPTTLPLPWTQVADAFCWPPGTQARARSGPQAAGARIVA